jgi:hypothetical protein
VVASGGGAEAEEVHAVGVGRLREEADAAAVRHPGGVRRGDGPEGGVGDREVLVHRERLGIGQGADGVDERAAGAQERDGGVDERPLHGREALGGLGVDAPPRVGPEQGASISTRSSDAGG